MAACSCAGHAITYVIARGPAGREVWRHDIAVRAPRAVQTVREEAAACPFQAPCMQFLITVQHARGRACRAFFKKRCVDEYEAGRIMQAVLLLKPCVGSAWYSGPCVFRYLLAIMFLDLGFALLWFSAAAVCVLGLDARSMCRACICNS